MSHNHKIVVMMLGGARRVSVAEQIRKSGSRIGCDVELVSYELSSRVPISIVSKVVEGLRWAAPEVIDDIVRVARENEVSIILPFVDAAIEIAAQCRERLPGVFIPVVDFETATRMFDKTEASKAFLEARLPIPQTYSVLNAEVPVIAKPRKGSSSRGIRVFHNMDELMHLDNLNSFFLQEYIEKFDEYTVDCYVSQQGEILVTVPRLRIEVQGGEATRTETIRNERIMGMCRDVIEAFSLRGPVTIQFIHDLVKDRILLLEVNPRLGSGVVCSIYAGAPITDYILQEALGVPVRPCDDWAGHTLMTRYMKEVIFFNGEPADRSYAD